MEEIDITICRISKKISLSKKIRIKICFFSSFSIKWNKKSWCLVKIGVNKNLIHK